MDLSNKKQNMRSLIEEAKSKLREFIKDDSNEDNTFQEINLI